MLRGKIYFDGGIFPHPNGGFAYCYGWVLKVNGQTVFEGNDMEIAVADTGSCHAEFGALARALKDAAAHMPNAELVEIYGDSKSVMEICSGAGVPKSSMLAQSKALVDHLASRLRQVRFNWIPRELNGEADRLGRAAFANSPDQVVRVALMNKINSRARGKFGNFYDPLVMSEWIKSVSGKRKLSRMSVDELKHLLGQIRLIPEFIRDYVMRCNTVAQAAPVRF